MGGSDWVILELTPRADREDPAVICQSIRHHVRNAEVYIPTSVTEVGDNRLINPLFSGYAFIKRAFADDVYYKLEETRFVQSIVTRIEYVNDKPRRKLATVSDEDIEKFQQQVAKQDNQGIEPGDLVLVTSGAYKQIQATVIEDVPENDTVTVHVRLRSKETLVTLPRSFLLLLKKAPINLFRERAALLRAWVQTGPRPLVNADGSQSIRVSYDVFVRLDQWIRRGKILHAFLRPFDGLAVDRIRAKYDEFQQLQEWLDNGLRCVSIIRAVSNPPPDPQPLQRQFKKLARVDVWLERGRHLHRILSPSYTASSALQGAQQRWSRIEILTRRVGKLGREVNAIGHAMGVYRGMSHTNLIVDGTQLAIRCAMAPGLGDLKDTKGRPTGAIVGFLQSVSGWQKKFEPSAIWVTWDGSNQRRRAKFAAYKSNRGEHRGFFEIQYLQRILGAFGVRQAWNQQEEADDAMATLVRTQLVGEKNYIVSTDRDLLQLVDANTFVYVPSVGSGKEKLYDTALVQAEYGVRPDQMVHLRALIGDTSDTIPGAPGFGPKNAAKLIGLYGTVEAIFSSSLTGLSRSQYEKLRQAEHQVRLNVDLMQLQSSIPLDIQNPNPDQIAAEAHLREIDVKPKRIISAFFAPAA